MTSQRSGNYTSVNMAARQAVTYTTYTIQHVRPQHWSMEYGVWNIGSSQAVATWRGLKVCQYYFGLLLDLKSLHTCDLDQGASDEAAFLRGQEDTQLRHLCGQQR